VRCSFGMVGNTLSAVSKSFLITAVCRKTFDGQDILWVFKTKNILPDILARRVGVEMIQHSALYLQGKDDYRLVCTQANTWF